jgi:hypothetical protein
MKKQFTAALVLAAAVSMPAHAGFISGNYTLANGNNVALQGLEWMPLTYTVELSRVDIEDGFTDRFGGVWNAGDWRYASLIETKTLLGSLWGGSAAGWSNNNYVGANWFLSKFGGLANDTGYGSLRVDGKFNSYGMTAWDWSQFVFGDGNDCELAVGLACWGVVSAFENSDRDREEFDGFTYTDFLVYIANSGPSATFGNGQCMHLCPPSYPGYINNSSAFADYGHLLVRNAPVTPNPVPEPAAISFLGLGLLGLFLRHRRKVSK